MNSQLKFVLKRKGIVTKTIRNSHFQGWDFRDIRKELEKNGLDPHMCIELDSTEIAIMTPKGILMQVRNYDKECGKTLGLWGGVIEYGETPEKGAMREVKEETGLDVVITEENLIEINTHNHEYANGDKALFHTYRYRVELDYVPRLETDEESTGYQLLQGLVLDHQREYVRRMLNGNVKNP